MKTSLVLLLIICVGLTVVLSFEEKNNRWYDKNSTTPNRLLVSYIDHLTSYWGATTVA